MGVGNNELPGESELTDTWGTQHNKRERRQTKQATLVVEISGTHQMSMFLIYHIPAFLVVGLRPSD